MPSILEHPAVRQRVTAISVETYHMLMEQKLVDERTELLRGVIIEKMTKSPLHEFIAYRLYDLTRAVVGPGVVVRKEGPLTFADSEPEPDIAVVVGRATDFRNSHPTTAIFVAEVAVSTEDVDREKVALYAEAGVEEYWLVLPVTQTVEAFSQPKGSAYGVHRVVGPGGSIESVAVPGLRVTIDALFG